MERIDLNTESLKEYNQAVEYNALNKVNFVFKNDGNEKALIVFKNIFKSATQQIQIVANDLNNVLTNHADYRSSLTEFLEKSDVKLDILLFEDKINGNNSSIASLLRRFTEKITLKISKGKSFKDNDSGKKIHFCVADNSMYRLEYDVEERKAQCNFNDPVKAGSLKALFYKAFKSEDVESLSL